MKLAGSIFLGKWNKTEFIVKILNNFFDNGFKKNLFGRFRFKHVLAHLQKCLLSNFFNRVESEK